MKDNKEQFLRIVIRNICKITITKCQKNVHINIFMLLLLLIIFYYFTNSTSLSDELEDFKFRNFKIKIICLILTQPKNLDTKVRISVKFLNIDCI